MNDREPPLAIALDLGSTYLKAGLLGRDQRLTGIESSPAPKLEGEGLIRECDGRAYADVAERLLASVSKKLPAGRCATPLGLASQRSTFILWDRQSGEPVTPMISWQDRRAADWCSRNRGLESEIVSRTGLLLSAHYAGPKLASLLETDSRLCESMRSGQVLFGNLDTYLIWCWTSGKTHHTDLTMAARTLMLDLELRDWSDRLLDLYRIPRRSRRSRSLPWRALRFPRDGVTDRLA